MAKDVKKIVFRHDKVRTRCTRCSRGAVALAAWVVGLPVGLVLWVAVVRIRTAPTTRRQLVVGESAAIP